MATNPKNRGSKAASNLPRPRRTVVLFLAAIIALYGLVALIDLNHKKGDDSAWKPKLGLDLEGGTRITFEAKATKGKVDRPKLDQARNIIDQRVNATGVTEAEVTTQGGNQIIVEIPGQKQCRHRRPGRQDGPDAIPPRLDPEPDECRQGRDTSAEQKIIDGIDWCKLSLDQMITAETTGLESLPKDVQPGIAALQKQAAGFVCAKGGVEVDDVSEQAAGHL